MWRERIIEAKRERGVSTKTMSERSRVPEKTITRILTGKTENPYISTVIDLGASVGLSTMELFAETSVVIGDQNLAALQTEFDRLGEDFASVRLDMEKLMAENAETRDKLVALSLENALLKKDNEHKDELIDLYKEILSLHRLHNS